MSAHHISTDDLERFHFGQVQAPELAAIEHHLLWCPGCRHRLQAMRRFVVYPCSGRPATAPPLAEPSRIDKAADATRER